MKDSTQPKIRSACIAWIADVIFLILMLLRDVVIMTGVFAVTPFWFLGYLFLKKIFPGAERLRTKMRNIFWPHFTQATLIVHAPLKPHIAFGGGFRENGGLWLDDTFPKCKVCGIEV